MFNETSNSSIGTNFTSFQEDDRDWSQLMYIIALGAVLVCGCCVGFYVVSYLKKILFIYYIFLLNFKFECMVLFQNSKRINLNLLEKHFYENC